MTALRESEPTSEGETAPNKNIRQENNKRCTSCRAKEKETRKPSGEAEEGKNEKRETEL